MARELGDLIVRLSLDSAKFEDGMKRFETQIKGVEGQFKNSTTGITDFDKATAKLRTSADTLSERLKLQKDKVDELESAYQKSVEIKGADAEETQKLARKLEDAKAKMQQTEKALELVNGQIAKNENAWYRLSVNLDGVGQKLQTVGKNVTAVGTTMSARVTAPIVALGTACVKTFTTFDDSMRTVQATMGLVEGSSDSADAAIRLLRDTAKEMGATTRFTASQAADALNYLALAGYDADKACATLPTILELASAGAMDLAQASDMVTDAMSALGIQADKEGKNVTRFADELAVTAQKSNTNIAQLGEAILAVGGTARNLAGGTVELNTALGIFADNGIKGAEGGTKLRNVILAMTPETQKAKDAFKQLGIQSYDANGNLRPLEETFGDINTAMAGMTQKQKTEWLNKVFNKQDLKAVSALLAATATSTEDLSFALSQGEFELDISSETLDAFIATLGTAEGEVKVMESLMNDYGLTNEQAASVLADLNGVMDGSSTRFEELSGYIEDCEGATQQMSDTMEGGIGGSFRSLMSAMEGLAIAFGERLAPHIQAIADKLTELARKFTELSPETQDMIIQLGLIAAAIGPVLVIVGKVITSVGTIMRVLSPLVSMIGGVNTATGALGAVFTALTGPIGIVVAAVAGLTAIFVTLYNTNEEFRDKMNAVWDSICAALEPVKAMFQNSFAHMKQSMEPVKEALGQLWETVQDVFLKLWNFLEPVLIAIGATLGGVVTVVIGVANGIMNAIGPLLEALVSAVDFVLNVFGALIAFLSGDFAGAWESLKAAFSSLWDTIVGVFTAIGAYWTGFWDGIITFLSGFGIDIQAIFSGIWSGIQNGLTTAWNAIGGWLYGAWNGIKDTASTAWTGITTGITSAVDGCKTGIESAWNAVTSWLSTTWEGIKGTAANAWAGITTGISTAVDTCKLGIETAWNAASTWLSTTWEGIKTTASTVWDGVTTGISSAVETCKSGIETAWNTAKINLSTTWEAISTTASTTWDSIKSGISTAVDSCKTAIENAWTTAKTNLTNTWNTLKTTATTTWDGIKSGISTAVNTCKSGIESAWNTAKTNLTNTWNAVKATATSTWDGIKSSISTAVDTCKSGIESAWNTAKTNISATWNALKTTATTTWNSITTNVQNAVTSAKAGIENAWTSISTGISGVWTSLKNSVSGAWSAITGAVKSAVEGGKSGIVSAWESVKTGVSNTWNKVLDVIKTPITTAQNWLKEKVDYFKGLFNFTWKLPEFKLPKIEVSWKDVGWGISIPNLSLKWNALGGVFRNPTIFNTANAGLQGVGEAGPEAILPLDALWEELSVRLKSGMHEILTDMRREEAAKEDQLARIVAAALSVSRKDPPSVNVTQHIHAEDTSYVGQQREAARNFRQIARALI